MDNKVKGRVIKGVGGLYTVRVDKDGGELAQSLVRSRARGVLRRDGMQVLAGDSVFLSYDASRVASKHSDDEASFVIDSVCERKNSLIRPPLANLDYLFITVAAASPAPVLLTVDKLVSICVYNDIEPVIDEFAFMSYGGRVLMSGVADEVRDETGKSLDELFREVFRC